MKKTHLHVPKSHPLVRRVHVLAEQKRPIHAYVGDASPYPTEYPPRRTAAYVLREEDGTQYRAPHGGYDE